MRTLSIVGAAALVTGLLTAPLSAEAAAPPAVPTISQAKKAAAKFPAGTYIVTLKQPSAATYKGGITGYARTQVVGGKQLDASSSSVQKYTGYLRAQQNVLARTVGAKVLYNYTVAYNGFGAKLTSIQATRLASSSAVAAVTPAETLKLQESHSLDFIDVSTPGGTWDQIGGVANAGEGVVLGDIDSGIAPENPSFAGDPLGTTAGDAPYLDGDTVTFDKADGGTFTSTEIGDADQWDDGDLSTKIIAAKYFVDGFGENKIGHPTGDPAVAEYLSPRDGSGHGSHTASTAAGNHDVDASVEGIDFGTISGVAPAAKIAVYKACWSGPDGIEASDDDGCNTLDLLAAINQAVTDGVDVINYSIGGGSAQTTYSPTDAAFLNAAAAGVFVAASAGNDGPAASTLDNAAPWETTVAASTIPDYEGTVVLGTGDEYVGASVSLIEPGSVGPAPFVQAADVALTSAPAADAARCFEDTLDPAKATGKIVLCDRGSNDRVAKSAEVARVGGIGMVLANVVGGADDVDNDFHSVPSVHVHASAAAALHAYAATPGATVTLEDGNLTDDVTPTPQVAGFSSHGPVLAAGSDVLKPDVSAPGVSILAAYASAEGEDPQWAFLSGTSMAAPHISGLALIYLGEHPNATPAEIKSAMMTTSTDLVDADGADVTDPFTQGAGQVHPSSYLDAGLYYPAGLSDWESYIVGEDQYTDWSPYVDTFDPTSVDPIDGSDLNQASIAIGDLIGEQTVTRTVTALDAGTYTATIDVPGINATVSPTSLDLSAGESADFTVTFAEDDAPADEWASGFLTWTSADHEVRSPVAIHPSTALTPPTVEIDGDTTGTGDVTFTSGTTGSLDLSIDGFTRGDVTPNADDPSLPYTGIAINTGDPDVDYADAFHVIGAGVDAVEFDTYPTVSDSVTDLDLYVIYCTDDTFEDCALAGQSATSSASESVVIEEPQPGIYISETDFYATPEEGTPYVDVAFAYDADANEGQPEIESPVDVSAGEDATATVSWWGLQANSLYRGFVGYGDTDLQTVLDVTTGDSIAPTVTTAPTFTGNGVAGSTLTADPGTWSESDEHMSYSYQWTAGGEPIAGATSATFVVPGSLLGSTIGLVVTGRIGPDPDAASTVSTATTTVVATGTDGGTALVSTGAPALVGSVQIGKSVGVSTGAWNVPDTQLSFGYQWLSDGAPISGATGSTYTVPNALLGHLLSVTVTASVGGKSASASAAPVRIAANDGNASLVNATVPTVEGAAEVGQTVTATDGTWNVANSDLTFTYQWVTGGSPIVGATASSFTIPTSFVGDDLAVTVTAHLGTVASSATSVAVTPTWGSSTKISIKDSKITTKQRAKVTVTVKADGSGKEVGKVVLHYGSKKLTDVMKKSDKGSVTFTLPRLKKGKYVVSAEFVGTATVASSVSPEKKLTVKKA